MILVGEFWQEGSLLCGRQTTDVHEGLLYEAKWFNCDQNNFETELVVNHRRVDM